MLRLVIFTILALLCCSPVGSQPSLKRQTLTKEKPSVLRFESSDHDFGRIKEMGGNVSHTFTFTNTSKTPVVIEDVEASCGCTTPSFSQKPVMPGKTETIIVTFDPAYRPGPFVKEVVVVSNNRSSRNTLVIRGDVIPRPRTVEDDYPVYLGSGLRLTNLSVNFRYVAQGKPVSMSLGIMNNSDKTVAISTSLAPEAYLTTAAPKTLKPGQKDEITVTVNPSTSKWGTINSNMWVSISGKRTEHPVRVSAIATDDFTSVRKLPAAKAPKARFSTLYHHFGNSSSQKPLTKDFVLFNDGGQPLIIRAVECQDGMTTTLKQDVVVGSGKSHKFTVTLTPDSKTPVCAIGIIRIVTNDPVRPSREIRLAVNIE